MTAVTAQGDLVDAIRADLLAGRFAPGQRLVEGDLADDYGVPRAAVRMALMTLSVEGLVDRQPHRGASVRELTIAEGIEIARIRGELEGLCARHAAIAAAPRERAELLGFVEAMRIATEHGRHADYLELSAGFHERIAEVSRHDTARRFLREIRNHRLERHFPDIFGGGTSRDSSEQHAAIGRAIAAGDADAAELAMREHVGHLAEILERHAARRDVAVLQQ